MVETHPLERPSAGTDLDSDALADEYRAIRRASEALCEPLEPELCRSVDLTVACSAKSIHYLDHS